MRQDVAVYMDSNMVYPEKNWNFRPDTLYPEYKNCTFQSIAKEKNTVYAAVRNAFILMEYDKENIGKHCWNPLKEIIRPGEHVLIKPNMVMHVNGSGEGEDCLYTHPSVVAAIIDYTILALTVNGEFCGKITVGDAPMQECNFEVLIKESGYGKLIEYYKQMGFEIILIDFRNVKTRSTNGIRVKQQEDCNNGVIIKLNEKSNFAELDAKRLKNLRITNYDPSILQKHHNEKIHEYKVANEILDADVIINMPKPKTHRKAGVTIALKNLVGINANKEYLPHHTLGSVEEGGDAYLYKNTCLRLADYLLDMRNAWMQKKKYKIAKILNVISRALNLAARIFYKKNYREGSWYGNDTIWRTIYDLNTIVFYADKKGTVQDRICRKMLVVADMVVAGENDGPVKPSPKQCGIVAVGENPGCFDEAVCSLMGFRLNCIPTLFHLRENGRLPIMQGITEGKIVSNNPLWNEKKLVQITERDSLKFKPNPGWNGR